MESKDDIPIKRVNMKKQSTIPKLPPIQVQRPPGDKEEQPKRDPKYETLGVDSLHQIPDSPKERNSKTPPGMDILF